MSVYTAVSSAELEAWLTRYAVGTLVEQVPIASGIENTNYFVTTTRGRWVLTLFERLPAEELPFYLNLMAHLARAGVACPAPAPDRSGALFGMLNGKPAGLTQRIDGVPIVTPDAAHCAAVGEALGRLHLASASYRSRLGNRRGPAWWRQAARAVRPYVSAEQNELLAAELRLQTGFGKVTMPKGAIHGDLFCDNVLFSGERVAGLIDFGFAATDFYAYDLAITVNDWCIARDGDARGSLVHELLQALLDGYQSVRPLTPVEREQWPSLLRAAALRFWLSRLYDLHLPRPGELVHAHDPAHFERILRDRIARPSRITPAGRVAR
ncbi:MAG: homoserine kinase [Betaproteobacteria bacterium]|nr:homoserine kinase [Betaproteobacteria bacterium]MBK8688511.1 homoserine kinase [Betaproteobacteria bacterium]MBK9675750.1 homoserine kinase [Betaproteobacteria bacterium]